MGSHREVLHSTGEIPDHVHHLFPRLRNPEETDVVIVTLPEATPVLEVERLQEDLKRARIIPSWWVVNQSWQSVATSHTVLVNRAYADRQLGTGWRYCKPVYRNPWRAKEPVGEQQLREFIGG